MNGQVRPFTSCAPCQSIRQSILVRLKHGHDVCNHIEQTLRTGLDPEHGRAEEAVLRLAFYRLYHRKAKPGGADVNRHGTVWAMLHRLLPCCFLAAVYTAKPAWCFSVSSRSRNDLIISVATAETACKIPFAFASPKAKIHSCSDDENSNPKVYLHKIWDFHGTILPDIGVRIETSSRQMSSPTSVVSILPGKFLQAEPISRSSLSFCRQCKGHGRPLPLSFFHLPLSLSLSLSLSRGYGELSACPFFFLKALGPSRLVTALQPQRCLSLSLSLSVVRVMSYHTRQDP